MKILFCVHAVTQVSFIESLKNAGHDIDLIVPHFINQELVDFSQYTTYPTSDPNNYKETIASRLETNKYDWLFPSWADDHVEFIANLDPKFNFGGVLPSTAKFLKSKMHYYKVFEELGIPYPQVYGTVDPYQQLDKLPDGMTFPIVAKPSYIRSKPGMEVFEDPTKLLKFVTGSTAKTNKQYQPMGFPYMLQRYIIGTSCAVSGVVKNGKVFVDFAYDIEPAYPFCPEAGMLYPSINEEMLLTKTVDPLERFFKHIEFTDGIFNMDIIVDQDKNFYFLDFAGRLGTHPVMLMYHSGEHDIAKKLVDKLLYDIDYVPNLKQAVIFRSLKLDPGVIKSISCSRPGIAETLQLPNKVIKFLSNDTKVYENGCAVIVGETREQAEQKYQELRNSITVDYEYRFKDRYHEYFYETNQK